MKVQSFLFIFCANLVLQNCNNSSLNEMLTVDRLAKKTMEDFKNLKYLVATLDGSMIMIPMDVITTEVIKDEYSKEGKVYNPASIVEVQPLFFDVPKNIKNYELITSKNSFNKEYCSIDDNKIKNCAKYDEKTFTYKVETSEGFVQMRLLFLRVDGAWKLGATTTIKS